MNACGINRAVGVRMHDLRYERAQDEFTTHSGAEPPVQGGRLADKEAALAAKHAVSRMLGQSRPQITSVYIGSGRHTAQQRNAIARNGTALDALLPSLVDHLLKAGAVGNIYWCGARSMGRWHQIGPVGDWGGAAARP